MSDESPRGLVLGTAGHIDHGKTSMVRTLTGVDLDALPEEQARGITIALGFTSMELADGRKAAFVDCPGHERLIRTMVAGVTGIDAVLLCVSAVDGVMPQTREHLSILGLLGVARGAVVLTMSDLVDEELLELAREDVSDAVLGTFLEGAPIVNFSSVTGVGVDELKSLVNAFPSTQRVSEGAFRLPVDRAFVRPGFGTVVTGTAWSGSLSDGDIVRLLPSNREARVRGIQTHGVGTKQGLAGRRTALNLAGVEKSEVPRGTVVTSGTVPNAAMVDVQYTHLEDAPLLEDGCGVRVLLGTSERIGRMYAAADQEQFAPGATLFAQIRLDAPLPCLPGDRFVIRRTSPLETLGGGIIVDPWTRRMRQRDRIRFGRELERLHGGASEVFLERAGEEGLSEEGLRERTLDAVGVLLGDRLFAAPVVARLQGALLDALTSYHAENPLSLGAHLRELRRGRLGHLGDRVFDALVGYLSENKSVHVDGPLVRIAGFSVRLDADQEALRQRIQTTLSKAGLEGVEPKDLHKKHPEAAVSGLMRLVESDGFAVQIPGVGWVTSEASEGLHQSLRVWFSEHEVLTPGDFKDLTGLTRKRAIPLLEWLDKSRLTRRAGEGRMAGTALSS
jgi:selenocysteine-specific elongation factor